MPRSNRVNRANRFSLASSFQNRKLPLQKLIKTAYLSCQQVGRKVGVDVGHTTVDWYTTFRDLCFGALAERQQRIGGYHEDAQLVPKIAETSQSFSRESTILEILLEDIERDIGCLEGLSEVPRMFFDGSRKLGC